MKDRKWPPRSREHYGLCPRCYEVGQRQPGVRVDTAIVNLMGELMPYWRWMVCRAHKLKWRIGHWYPFIGTMEELKANTKLLETYKTVEPIKAIRHRRQEEKGAGLLMSRTRA